MKRTLATILTIGFLSAAASSPLWAASRHDMMDMTAMQQQMQSIVNETDQEKRQVLLDDHIRQMQPSMQMCQKMMGGDMPMMDGKTTEYR